MSIKNTQAVGQQTPTGTIILQQGEGGPQRMICPRHKLAATPRSTGKGKMIWFCPQGCQFGGTHM